MIKLNNRFSFKTDNYGYRLTETYATINPKTKEPSTSTRDTFHPNLESLAAKVVFLSGEDVKGNIDDLKNAWFSCVQEIKKCMEEKVNE